MAVQRVDLSGTLQAFGALQAVNADNERRREARKANMIGTAGTVVGALAGAGLTGGSLQGAQIGAGLGRTGATILSGGAVDGGGAVQGALQGLQGFQTQQAQATEVEAQRGVLRGVLADNPIDQTNQLTDRTLALSEDLEQPTAEQDAAITQSQDVEGALSPAQRGTLTRQAGILRGALPSQQPLQTATRGLALSGALRAPPPLGDRERIGLEQENRLALAREREGLVRARPAAGGGGGFTLRPGQTRFGQGGEPIASVPKEDEETRGFFAGKGVKVQDSRILTELSQKPFADLTDDEKRAYTISYDRVTKPQIRDSVDESGNPIQITTPGLQLNRDLFPIPPGFEERALPPQQQAAQTPARPTGQTTPASVNPRLPTGFKKIGNKAVPATEAAKVAMLFTAKDTIAKVRNAVITPEGIDRSLIFTMSIDAPFSEGRQRKQEMKDALEAKIRAESGAAVPDSEIVRLLDRFMPSNLDSDAGIRSKFDRFDLFLNTAIKLSGRKTVLAPGDKGFGGSSEISEIRDLVQEFGLEQ